MPISWKLATRAWASQAISPIFSGPHLSIIQNNRTIIFDTPPLFKMSMLQVIDTQTKLYLVLELGDGGDMYDYIMKHEGGLGEETARKYFRQIVTAIQYCHKLHVVHRDLKPENVVFFEKLGMVKLTDFGFSNKFNPGQNLLTSCGSLAYSAPEILLGDAYDAPAVGKLNLVELQLFRCRLSDIQRECLVLNIQYLFQIFGVWASSSTCSCAAQPPSKRPMTARR